VLSKINHPYIVGLNFAFQTKDKLYFVLDYCAGGELFFHLGNVRLDWQVFVPSCTEQCLLCSCRKVDSLSNEQGFMLPKSR